MTEEILVRKLKVIKNPTRKSARQLLNDINKPNYECEITNKGIVKVKIFKNGVPMSLNDKKSERDERDDDLKDFKRRQEDE
jgi:hypothetical protein